MADVTAPGLVPGIPDLALMGLAISTVGACRHILDLTVAHVKQRVQFGVPIGSFQAVKHKAADMYVAIERARALAYFSALRSPGVQSPVPMMVDQRVRNSGPFDPPSLAGLDGRLICADMRGRGASG